ncbi:hypothetical protein [Pandoraea pnomenusa]|uniref:hypothetical protein n=1 Tax=Pandoraea pnomenusa TaxID=93220 RepID=UPI0011477AE4|nr:hypothetical protein [Pandoraea pnomenusa]QDH60954.1 hypothetical protein FKQ53_17905 [Pandoraea pnomenusa]
MEARRVTQFLDEIALAPAGNLHLPMPVDARPRKIDETIMDHSADRRTIRIHNEWVDTPSG